MSFHWILKKTPNDEHSSHGVFYFVEKCYNKLMATVNQLKLIKQLATDKMTDFKEFKEFVLKSEIVSENNETIKKSLSSSEIINALTDWQASKIIDKLEEKPDLIRLEEYDAEDLKKINAKIKKIKQKIDDWSF